MKPMVSEAAPASPEEVRHVTEMIQAQVPMMVEKHLDSHGGSVRFKDHGPEVTKDVRDFVRELIQKYGRPNQYASEEASSTYVYPPEFKGPKPIIEQINVLAAAFDLDPTTALKYMTELPDMKTFVPEDTLPFVGWYAFPRTVERNVMLEKLAESRRFYNYRSAQMDRFQVHARTVALVEKLAEQQGGGDILLVPAQLGMRHRGRSTRRADECLVRNEFGLHTVAGGAIAFTHPERFVRFEQLHMDLPGDKFDDPGAGVRFGHAACLGFGGGGLRFDAGRFGDAYGYYGSASGFVPQG